MNNKFVMSRNMNVNFIKKYLTRFIYRSMKLARYEVTFEQVEEILNSDVAPKSEIEIATINFKQAWDKVLEKKDEEIDKDFLLQLHHILMKGLNENVETELTDIQCQEVHIMINQPAKANTEIAIDVLEYILDKKLFSDGDVRVAIMFANKIMLEGGCGVITIREGLCDEFRKYLKMFHEENGFKQFKNWIYRTSVEGVKHEYY